MELLAYGQLDAVRDAVVAKLRTMIRAGAGTEARRSALMQLTPEDVGLKSEGDERVLNHFKVAVLSEGRDVSFSARRSCNGRRAKYCGGPSR